MDLHAKLVLSMGSVTGLLLAGVLVYRNTHPEPGLDYRPTRQPIDEIATQKGVAPVAASKITLEVALAADNARSQAQQGRYDNNRVTPVQFLDAAPEYFSQQLREHGKFFQLPGYADRMSAEHYRMWYLLMRLPFAGGIAPEYGPAS